MEFGSFRKLRKHIACWKAGKLPERFCWLRRRTLEVKPPKTAHFLEVTVIAPENYQVRRPAPDVPEQPAPTPPKPEEPVPQPPQPELPTIGPPGSDLPGPEPDPNPYPEPPEVPPATLRT